MEHYIAQNSPISPRKKGMEGSRQALLYGVYDAFAGARTLISKRLCALITAIGIAVLTISSSAWASHDDTAVNEVTNVETDGTTDAGTGTIGDGSVHNEHLAEVNDLTGMPATNPGTEGAVGPLNINNDAITSRTIGGEQVCGSENNDACGFDDVTGAPEARSHIRPDSIGSADIADGGVTGAVNPGTTPSDITPGSIGTADLAPNAVTSTEIVDGTITSADLEVVDPGNTLGAVNTNNIRDDAVTNAKLDSNAVSGSGGTGDRNIEANSIDTAEIMDGAVEGQELAAGEVCGSADEANCAGTGNDRTHIKTGSIGSTDLASDNAGVNGAVNEDNINNGAVTADKLGADAVTNAKLDSNAVSGSGGTGDRNIEANSIDTAEIMDGAVEGQELGMEVVCGSVDNAACGGQDDSGTNIQRAHIRANSIGTTDIAQGGVATDEIMDGTVTGGDGTGPNPGDIAQNTVTGGNIAADTITGGPTGNIRGDTITAREIGPNAVTNSELAPNAVQEANIGVGQVCGSEDTAPGTPCASGTNKHIGAGTIGTTDLAEVDTSGPEEGQNGAVNTANINTDAVDTRTLANVDGSGQNGAVNTDNINTGAVDGRTLDSQVVCGSGDPDADCGGADGPKTHIKAGSIGTDDLANFVVTADKIDFNAVEDRHIADRAVRANHIDDGQIGLRHLNEDVNNVFRRIEGDIDRLDEGIAMSHAISMIKVPEGKEFGISFAGGFYQDKQAAAIGVGFRPSDGLLLSAGASYGFDSQEVGGAVSINFGF